MSVVERYAVRPRDFEEGLVAATRLAARTGATLRWVAAWLDPAEPRHRERHAELVTCFGARLVAIAPVDPETLVACIAQPTPDEARDLFERAAGLPVVLHASPVIYQGEAGPEGQWISFVDHEGFVRDDARVYRIELAESATPLTLADDRPAMSGFGYGPEPASGWHLHLSVVRDHMPRSEFARWLAETMAIPIDAIRSPPE